jgi:hypothetical protein
MAVESTPLHTAKFFKFPVTKLAPPEMLWSNKVTAAVLQNMKDLRNLFNRLRNQTTNAFPRMVSRWYYHYELRDSVP